MKPLLSLDRRVIDVTKAPYFADPSGVSDSTEAIVAALTAATALTLQAFHETVSDLEKLEGEDARHPAGVENRKVRGKLKCVFPAHIPYIPTIYLPVGTYLVSGTIIYEHERLWNSGGSEMNMQIRIRGAGPSKTILRLLDFSPQFQGTEPKPVLSIMRGTGSCIAMSNYVEDLCIDTGRGNPAAVGLDFFANNSGAVRNVKIRGDGQASWGLSIGHNNYSGILIKSVYISGFETGLHIDSGSSTMFMAGEDIFIKDCQIGVYAGRPSSSLRHITVKNCETGVRACSAGGLLTLVDSILEGYGKKGIDVQDSIVYLSRVRTIGFGDAESIDHKIMPEHQAVNGEVMGRLNVSETPQYRSCRKWCEVDDFGADRQGRKDSSNAIQAALDCGKSEIHFGAGKYLIDKPVSIPASVKNINFNFCDLIAGPNMGTMKNQGAFIISEDADNPLFIEDLLAWEQWRGEHIMFDHASKRTLVLSDIHTQTLPLYRNSVTGGKVYLENVACTAGVIPGSKGHGRVCLYFHGQEVWARQLNPERGEPMVINDGGSLWVLGFKAEDDATAFHTKGGGQTEILGGVLNGGGHRHASFLAENSSMRITCSSNGWGVDSVIQTTICEEIHGKRKEIHSKEFPARKNFSASRGRQFIVPIYASARKVLPADT